MHTIKYILWVFIFNIHLSLAQTQDFIYFPTDSKIAPKTRATLLPQDLLLTTLESSYTKTNSNYSQDLNIQNLEHQAELTKWQTNLGFNYSFSDSFNSFLNFSYLVQNLNLNSQTITSYNVFGLSDLDFGIRLKLLKNFLFFELGAQLPAYQKPTGWDTLTSNSTLPLGNGLIESWILFPANFYITKNFNLQLALGARYRSHGFSKQGLSKTSLNFLVKKTFFRLQANYETPILQDSFSNSIILPNSRANTLVGGSHFYNAINPTFLLTSVQIGTEIFNKTDFSLYYAQTFFGKNYANFNTIGFNISYLFGEPPTQSLEISPRSLLSNNFINYEFEAQILEIAPKINQFIINKGKNDGLKLNEVLDVFFENQIYYQAKVIEIGPTRAKLKLINKFSNQELTKDFVVKKRIN
jgi:hypothetical protein